ncbi:superoxide dismutase family protein [Aerococcaceae bacterium DSM 111020]|nr:superoxide dismutase family protein [Aerococcaceae bacterium DSM 111020]
MKKSLRQFITLSSLGLVLGLATPVTTIHASDSSEADSQVESTDESESTSQTEEEYAFEKKVTVINNDEEEIGTAHFTEDAEGNVQLHLELSGLEEGEYGMHIHEVGLATAPTFEDAGSHFNPEDVEHGTESETGPHAGDLPNLIVGADGEVDEIIDIPNVTLDPEGENSLQSVDGTTLIIHTEADDYTSQPTGDAGDRQAAAVIFEPQEESEHYQASDDSEMSQEDSESEDTSDEASESDTDSAE